MQAEVKAICISEKRGTAKHDIKEAEFIENFGIKGDAHGGNWHRQVSLLSYDQVREFEKKGISVSDGTFGENILAKGIEFKNLETGTIITCNNVILKITQIGKQCHSKCEIFHQVGDCIMPREGVFAEVLQGGKIRVGDILYVE